MIVESCANGRPTLLAVHHGWGGGVERHVEDLAAICGERCNLLTMRPDGGKLVVISLIGPKHLAEVRLEPNRQREELLRLFRDCNVQRIHIHHFFGNEHYLESLISDLQLPFDFTVHDYHVLSPQPHLVSREGRFIGDHMGFFASCELVTFGLAPARPASLQEWQSKTQWLVTRASRVIVPSYDVLHRLRCFFPELRAVLAAHPNASRQASEPRQISLAPDQAFRIALLGRLAPHKGSRLLMACACLVSQARLPVEFHVIGEVPEAAQLRELGAKISGSYRASDLPELIKQHDPHVLWYPTQCPETFSYTLSEGLSANLPIVAANIGALAERLGGRSWTWIKAWDSRPDQWIAHFLAIRERHFLTGSSPEPFGILWGITDHFYRREYLDWIERSNSQQTRVRFAEQSIPLPGKFRWGPKIWSKAKSDS